MAEQPTPPAEAAPADQSYEFQPEGVAAVVQEAIKNLQEWKPATWREPEQMARDHDLGLLVRARIAALTSLVPRTDGKSWREVIEDAAYPEPPAPINPNSDAARFMRRQEEWRHIN